MSPLERLIRDLIRASGPISVARYMSLALYHPEHGYYQRRDPLGAAGDFVTAPEIGQVFGELIGLVLAQAWLDAGRPRARLVELGPGRGTLMADTLRAMGSVPGLRDALSVHLVETSPVLRAAQRKRLAGEAAAWHEALEEVPDDLPLFLLANELFDALPVHQLERVGGIWVERLIGLDEHGRLGFVRAGQLSPLAHDLPEAADGAVAEIAPARERLAAEIGRRIAESGGLALIVDYGSEPEGPRGDTLQAVRAHAPAPALDAPGEVDLTSHVDFGALKRAALGAGASAFGPLPQGLVLMRLGIGLRTRQLMATAGPEQRGALRSAERRLIAPEAMGQLFKMLAIAPAGAPPPPGFEDWRP